MSESILKAHVVISDHGLACFLEVSEFFFMMLSTRRRKVHHLSATARQNLMLLLSSRDNTCSPSSETAGRFSPFLTSLTSASPLHPVIASCHHVTDPDSDTHGRHQMGHEITTSPIRPEIASD
jgi:hypothetical protein